MFSNIHSRPELERTLRRPRRFAVACGLAGLATVAFVTTASPAVADEHPLGSAYALSVRTTLLNKPLVKVDPLPAAAYPKGGDESVVEVGPNLGGRVSAKVLSASSSRKKGVLASNASIAEVAVRDILSAKVVTAECKAGREGITGKSSVAELTVLGQKIDVRTTTDVNVLGVARVRINEQARHGDTLTVNAVHVTIGGLVRGVTSADIVLSQAKCSARGADEPESPPTTSTTPTDTSAPEEPSPTTSISEPTVPETTSSEAGGQADISPAADNGDLAETGVSAIVPISIGGLVFLLAGAGTVLYARRGRAGANASHD